MHCPPPLSVNTKILLTFNSFGYSFGQGNAATGKPTQNLSVSCHVSLSILRSSERKLNVMPGNMQADRKIHDLLKVLLTYLSLLIVGGNKKRSQTRYGVRCVAPNEFGTYRMPELDHCWLRLQTAVILCVK
jgi:hypothetical protein